jgi:hypothetical protein
MGTTGDCALTLMLLALWPGLDAIRRRCIWRKVGTGDEIAADILGRTTEAIRGLDLQRVNWIAATILRNVERDILRAHQREAGAKACAAKPSLTRSLPMMVQATRRSARRNCFAICGCWWVPMQSCCDPRGGRRLQPSRSWRRTWPVRGGGAQALPARHPAAARRPPENPLTPMSRSGQRGGFSHSDATARLPPTESRHA